MAIESKNTITLDELHKKCISSQEYNNIDKIANNVFVLKKQLDTLTKELDNCKGILLDYMKENKIDKILDKEYNCYITLSDVSIRKVYDMKTLEKKYNDIYKTITSEKLIDRYIKVML